MPTGLNDTLLEVAADAMKAAATHARLYTAEPDAGGTTNQATSGLEAITWEANSNGDLVVTADAPFTGGTASGPCTYVGLWDSGETTFYGYFALTGDQTFNAAGEYTLTGITITSSAT